MGWKILFWPPGIPSDDPLPPKQVHKALPLKDLVLETQNTPDPLGSCFQ